VIVVDSEYDINSFDFENSKEGLWISADKCGSVKSFCNSVIQLAEYLGFELEKEISEITNSEIDSVFLQAWKELDDWGYECDPGWRFNVDSEGLHMESIWTSDSDIWGEDREFATPLIHLTFRSMNQASEVLGGKYLPEE